MKCHECGQERGVHLPSCSIGQEERRAWCDEQASYAATASGKVEYEEVCCPNGHGPMSLDPWGKWYCPRCQWFSSPTFGRRRRE
jgi:hypothetical protein